MDFIFLLKEYKLKVTPQRLAIVEILSSNGHMSIDELFKSLQNQFPTLSLATVYKNIHAMSEKLLLSEVKIPDQKNVYELNKPEHYHIVCSKCDSIMDIDLDVSDLFKQAQSISHFKLDATSIVFNGVCSKCSA